MSKHLRKQVYLNTRIIKSIREACRILARDHKSRESDVAFISLGHFFLEVNDTVRAAFSKGYLSTGLVNLRLAQEVVEKSIAFQHKRSLIDKKKVPPRVVREVLEQVGLPGWKTFYKELSMITHQDREFWFRFYPHVNFDSHAADANKDRNESIRYYLIVLNVFAVKLLNTLYNELRDRVGSDIHTLIKRYRKFEAQAAADMESVNEEWVRATFGLTQSTTAQ